MKIASPSFWLSALVTTLGLAFSFSASAQMPEEQIRKALEPKLNEGAKIDEISKSPLPGLYEVRIGTDLLYADETGNYILQGNLIHLKTGQNLTRDRAEQVRADTEKAMMPTLWSQAALGNAVKLVKGNGTRKLVVFEDPYCGFCKKLRQSFEAMNDITVYTYMTTGLSPDSGKKARDMWCSTDRIKAYDDWMVRGKAPQNAETACADPVKKVGELARGMGVGPVPAIFFADGTKVAGYLPANDLEARLALVVKPTY